MQWKRFFWPVVGAVAVVFSLSLLYHEVRGISVTDVYQALTEIPLHRLLLSALGALVAYAAISGYDRIALAHIGRKVSPLFVALCSFTTYALSHNIGGSVLSGAVIRYRAYATKGLSGSEIGVLVAICWFTFLIAMVLVTSVLLVTSPELTERFVGVLPVSVSAATGVFGLLLVALYVFGSWLHLKPWKIAGMQLVYPRLPIVLAQLTIGPLEILAAASIVYFALPEAGNPGYVAILGIFAVAFSIASISHAPGGLGVFEYVALAGLTDMNKVSVLAALVVFRMCYLIIPLVVAVIVVIVFERGQFGRGVVAAVPVPEPPQAE